MIEHHGIGAFAMRRAALFLAAGLSALAPARAQGEAPTAVAGAVAPRASLALDLEDGRVDDRSLLEAALVASGVHDPAEVVLYRDRIAHVVSDSIERAGARGDEERRGRRLLEQLHRNVLRRYEASADRLDDLADHGLYNCVSATLLYLIAARQAGLDAVALEAPLHVAVLLRAGERWIVVETTSARGFDAKPLEGGRPVPAERALAFLYHNAGLRALQAGDAEAAARDLAAAARIVPDLAYRSEELRATLARAIRDAYDAGRFRDAFVLAEATMTLLPDRTTVTDRFVGVAARLVQETALAGRPAEAESLAARAMERMADEAARRKLERYVEPALARSAVLSRDWERARRHAARFKAIAADPAEGEHLARWVERRAETPEEGPGETARYAAEAEEAVSHPPGGADVGAYTAVVQAVATLAGLGRFEEALAVGRLQRQVSGADASRGGLDLLLRAVARGQVESLLGAERLAEAAAALRAALTTWPEDAALRTLAAHLDPPADDPAALAATQPATAAYAGAPSTQPPRP